MIYNSDATGDETILSPVASGDARTGRILLLLDLTGNDIISCREGGRSHWQNSAVTGFDRTHWQNSAVTRFDRKRYYLLSRAGTLALAEFCCYWI
ncbi:MAG: hypothetical protein EAZ25_29095 [Oscillatoriales cyanobacterium]|nr:MAG: hypothetical protein EAZ25_29095 [Oscillatoriales cyanobacterium]